MNHADTAAYVARILNAAYPVRQHWRPHARALRAEAIEEMAEALRAALAASHDHEALLYAVAVGLYDPHDRRFQI